MIPASFCKIPARGKVPLVNWKPFQDRMPTEQEYAEWEQKFANCDWGFVTGPISGILVLDIDGEEGEKSVKDKELPRTWEVKTPHGRHLYFSYPQSFEGIVTTKAGILNGVDIRGEGGYVAFYEWSVPPYLSGLAPLPEWLYRLIKEQNQSRPTLVERIKEIAAGSRNQSFASLAGGLRAKGYEVQAIFELLKPKAKEVQFDEDELWAVCSSIGRYEAPKVDGQGESIESFLADRQEVKWICQPFIAEQSIGIIGGLPESRKSWALIDLAIECARGGGLWLKKFPVKGCKVLLIDQERAKSEVQRRLQAVISGKGLSGKQLKGALFVRCGTSTRLNLEPSFNALRKEMTDIKPDLVLIDSFATIHTVNEISRMDIQVVMERLKQLRTEFNCAVVFIHHHTKVAHQNHKEGQAASYIDLAGNIAIPAAAEMVLSIVKHDEESSFVHHTKSTMANKAPSFLMKVEDLRPDKSEIAVVAY